MTPLLQALTDAARAGFDAPKCGKCRGTGASMTDTCWRCADFGWDHERECDPPPKSEPCAKCHGTSLDASDPERLIGRALIALLPIEPQFNRHGILRGPVIHLGDPDCPATVSGHHDGTPTSLATALLRLVARVGTPHPQTAPETRETETA